MWQSRLNLSDTVRVRPQPVVARRAPVRSFAHISVMSSVPTDRVRVEARKSDQEKARQRGLLESHRGVRGVATDGSAHLHRRGCWESLRGLVRSNIPAVRKGAPNWLLVAPA